LSRYYTGITDDLERHLQQHRRGKARATNETADWKVIWTAETADHQAARVIEKRIKARVAARFLADEGRA